MGPSHIASLCEWVLYILLVLDPSNFLLRIWKILYYKFFMMYNSKNLVFINLKDYYIEIFCITTYFLTPISHRGEPTSLHQYYPQTFWTLSIIYQITTLEINNPLPMNLEDQPLQINYLPWAGLWPPRQKNKEPKLWY